MKKKLIPILLITIFILAACGKADDNSPSADNAATTVIEGESAESTTENPAAEVGPFTSEEEPCKPYSFVSQSLGTPHPGLEEVSEDDLINGPYDATVTLLEYSQLTCPACGPFEPLLTALHEAYPDDVRVVFRHFPFQPKAVITAQAIEAANLQGKFIEFKDFMFDRKTKYAENPAHAGLPDEAFWGSVEEKDLDAWLKEYVSEIGIDADQLIDDMHSKKIEKKVQTALNSASDLGIGGTPALFINGYQWPQDLSRSYEVMSIIIQLIKSQELEYASCAPMVIDPEKSYSATISTTKGDIEVALFADIAPYTVNSFVYLAREGWYDDLPFFSTDEFILTGDPSDTSYGGPGYVFLDELSDDQTLEDPGKLATFSLGPGTNGSTFFINRIGLDGQEGRTVFGEVTKGMDLIPEFNPRLSMFDTVTDRVINITITEK